MRAEGGVNFGREVLPILSENCLSCHGQDEGHRKAKLRLDTQDGALKSVIVPGNVAESEFMKRIVSSDEDEVMPPPDSHKKRLQPSEVKTPSTVDCRRGHVGASLEF